MDNNLQLTDVGLRFKRYKCSNIRDLGKPIKRQHGRARAASALKLTGVYVCLVHVGEVS